MSLEEDLAERRRQLRAGLGNAEVALVRQSIDRNRMLQLAEQSLMVGDLLPDFVLPDTAGRAVASSVLLTGTPTVIAFFRGGWCPYCDIALKALEAVRPEIEAAGARLIGISPEIPEDLARTGEHHGLRFQLLSDAEGTFARLCGIRYEEAPAVKSIYRRLGIEFRERDLDGVWALPLPVSYVVDGDGRIAWLFVNPDWSYRAEPQALVEAVRSLGRDAA